MAKHLVGPNGQRVDRVLEVLYGTCGIENFEDAEGEADLTVHGVAFHYDGNGTDVLWDSQVPVKRAGKVIFLDEDGNYLTEDQLTIKDDSDGD